MNNQNSGGPSLARPTKPLSAVATRWLRTQHRLRAIPPRRIGAACLGLLAGFATYTTVVRAQATRSEWGEVVPVLVAAVDIAPGESLTIVNTELRSLPLALLPGDVLTEDRTGRYASAAIGAGQIISSIHLSDDRDGLTTGTRSVTVPMPLAPPDLVPGDTVDLMAVTARQSSTAATVLGQARVSAIGEDGLTVTVDRRLAPAIFQALGSGSVEFARRPAQG